MCVCVSVFDSVREGIYLYERVCVLSVTLSVCLSFSIFLLSNFIYLSIYLSNYIVICIYNGPIQIGLTSLCKH